MGRVRLQADASARPTPAQTVFYCFLRVCVCVLSLSRVRLFVTPCTVAYQASLSMEFSRQEHWSGLQFPTPEDLPNTGIGPGSLESPALAGRLLTISATCGAPLPTILRL